MRRLLRLLLCAAVAGAFSTANAAGAKQRSTVVSVKTGDPTMAAAIAEAQRTLPEFLALLNNPEGASDFSFKYPLAGWEHIWVERVERKGTVLAGVLANDPEAPGHAIGEAVRVPLSRISDWAYRDAAGLMHGHRTTRVLLPRLDPAQAAQIRRAFGWDD